MIERTFEKESVHIVVSDKILRVAVGLRTFSCLYSNSDEALLVFDFLIKNSESHEFMNTFFCMIRGEL